MEIKKTNSLFLNCFLFAGNQFSKIIVLSLFSTEAGWVILKQKVGAQHSWAPRSDLRAFVGGK